MFKLLVLTLACATVVLAATRYESRSSTVRPSGLAEQTLNGLIQNSYLSQDSSSKSQSASPSKDSGTNSSPSRVQESQQSRQGHSLDNLAGQFSQQKGQQARTSQQKNTSNVDFDGHF